MFLPSLLPNRFSGFREGKPLKRLKDGEFWCTNTLMNQGVDATSPEKCQELSLSDYKKFSHSYEVKIFLRE